jgi:hypothetical protein
LKDWGFFGDGGELVGGVHDGNGGDSCGGGVVEVIGGVASLGNCSSAAVVVTGGLTTSSSSSSSRVRSTTTGSPIIGTVRFPTGRSKGRSAGLMHSGVAIAGAAVLLTGTRELGPEFDPEFCGLENLVIEGTR